jgi:hypothetical protein
MLLVQNKQANKQEKPLATQLKREVGEYCYYTDRKKS